MPRWKRRINLCANTRHLITVFRNDARMHIRQNHQLRFAQSAEMSKHNPPASVSWTNVHITNESPLHISTHRPFRSIDFAHSSNQACETRTKRARVAERATHEQTIHEYRQDSGWQLALQQESAHTRTENSDKTSTQNKSVARLCFNAGISNDHGATHLFHTTTWRKLSKHDGPDKLKHSRMKSSTYVNPLRFYIAVVFEFIGRISSAQ